MGSFSKSLIAASSRPLILGILQAGPLYGYKISQRIHEMSAGQIEWADGMLYPILHKLEKEKLIESNWVQSEEGRHRKYYAITELGKSALHREKDHWLSMHAVMLSIWALKPATKS